MLEHDPPVRLPVDHLSVSSIRLFTQCSTKWKRRYIDREFEPPSGKMLVGSAVGAAEGQHYSTQIEDGQGLGLDDVLDLYADEWTERTAREDVDWGQDKPKDLRDSGQQALSAYHQTVAPLVVPTSVEREFVLDFPDVEWKLTGYLDLEEADGAVSDLKVRGQKLGQADADSDLQAAAYLLARRSEGDPASEFRFHVMVRTKAPYAEIVPTARTDFQLDSFTQRVYNVAAEMAWRAENEVWGYAPPGAWWCSERFCGYWSSCAGGGMK